jgi:hypothetical protein
MEGAASSTLRSFGPFLRSHEISPRRTRDLAPEDGTGRQRRGGHGEIVSQLLLLPVADLAEVGSALTERGYKECSETLSGGQSS